MSALQDDSFSRRVAEATALAENKRKAMADAEKSTRATKNDRTDVEQGSEVDLCVQFANWAIRHKVKGSYGGPRPRWAFPRWAFRRGWVLRAGTTEVVLSRRGKLYLRTAEYKYFFGIGPRVCRWQHQPYTNQLSRDETEIILAKLIAESGKPWP